MKIGPQPPRPPAPAEARAAVPSRPFEEYLGQDRAAGFTELGMFGRKGAQLETESPPPPPPPPQQAEDEADPAKPTTTPARCEDFPSGGTEAPPGKPASAAPLPDTPCSLPLPAGRHGPFRPGLPHLPSVLRGDDAGGDEGVGGSRARPARTRAATPGPSLLVAERDGAAEIVVGTRPMGEEERAQLRRLIQAILALNGLRLAHLQLNGAAESPDFKGLEGELDGTRPR